MIAPIADIVAAMRKNAHSLAQSPSDLLPITKGTALALLAIVEAAQTVNGTFERDLEQGYRTKDKEFAVSVLGKALFDFARTQ